MRNSPSDIVPFGNKYFYERSTKTIIVMADGSEPDRHIGLPGYMDVIRGRRRFSDSALALEIFADELKHLPFPFFGIRSLVGSRFS
jgi:hypothetical protein